jgi:hypothetical protein
MTTRILKKIYNPAHNRQYVRFRFGFSSAHMCRLRAVGSGLLCEPTVAFRHYGLTLRASTCIKWFNDS